MKSNAANSNPFHSRENDQDRPLNLFGARFVRFGEYSSGARIPFTGLRTAFHADGGAESAGTGRHGAWELHCGRCSGFERGDYYFNHERWFHERDELLGLRLWSDGGQPD